MVLRSKYFTLSFLCLYILQKNEILSTRILRDTLTRVVSLNLRNVTTLQIRGGTLAKQPIFP